MFAFSICKQHPRRSYHSSLCRAVFHFHFAQVVVCRMCVFVYRWSCCLLLLVCYYTWSICLLSDVCYFAVFDFFCVVLLSEPFICNCFSLLSYFCSVLWISWKTVVCRCCSFRLIWCVHLWLANNNPRRSYHTSFCGIVWIFILHGYLSVVFDGLYAGSCFLVYAITHNVYVCCLLFVLLPYCLFCCVSIVTLLFIVAFLLVNMMFVFTICKQQPRRSYHFPFP